MHRLASIVLILALAACGRDGGDADPVAQPPEGKPHLLLHGTYRYMADAGSFTECFTGAQWPVAMVGDNAALERGYLAAGGGGGEAMLVHLEGRVMPQPVMEGDSLTPMLVVDRFLSAEPGAACAPRYTTSADSGKNMRDATHIDERR